MGDFHIENFILFVVDNPPSPLTSSLFLPFLAENLLLSVISASNFNITLCFTGSHPLQHTLSMASFLASTGIPM